MSDIKLIVFDVDGTLTAGHVHLDADGREEKQFTVLDGLGFRLADAVGIAVAIISGRTSTPVLVRMAALPHENVLLKVANKAEAMRTLQERLGVTVDETAFVGDDINDGPAYSMAGVKIAVANAVPAIKRRADYITSRSGGMGAAREAIEWLLRRQNAYNKAIELYLEQELSNV